MKILFYLGANSGDLINFTGVLNVLSYSHRDYEFDLLIPRKQHYIVKNHPGVNKVLFLEDYPVPKHVLDTDFDIEVKKHFGGLYDAVINIWGKKAKDTSSEDFVNLMFSVVKEAGFHLPFTRKDVSPTFYYDKDDYKIVDSLYKTLPRNRKILLVEDSSFSWQSPQLTNMQEIINTMQDRHWLVGSGQTKGNFSINDLNLKQIKLFFETYCSAFFGISSGISCAIYTLPTWYINKRIVVSGIRPDWNIKHTISGSNNYYFSPVPYSTDIAVSLLES